MTKERPVSAGKNEPIKCGDCGVAMNHHAEKLVDPRNAAEARQVDSDLGGIVEATHTCPECGKMAASRSV